MVTQNVEDMVGVKGHIRNNAVSITSLHAQLETHCNIPHTVPQVILVDKVTTAQLNTRHLSMFHLIYMSNHHVIKNILIVVCMMITVSMISHNRSLLLNLMEKIKTNHIVPKTGPDIHYEGK